MGFKIMYMDGNGDFHDGDGMIYEYVCDSESDVSSLPTGAIASNTRPRPGSRALVLATSAVYVLSTDRTWTKLGE